MESAQLWWWRHQSAEGGNVAVPALYSLLAILVLVAVYVNLQALQQRNKLPPGPRGWPLVGNLPHLTKFGPPHRSLTTLAAKYGGLMYLRLGTYMCLHMLESIKHSILKLCKSTPLHHESKTMPWMIVHVSLIWKPYSEIECARVLRLKIGSQSTILRVHV